MFTPVRYFYRQLARADVSLLKDLLRVFGEAFDEIETYQRSVPSDDYLTGLLTKQHFIAVVAMNGQTIAGGLVAYELDKFEQDRREIYIYDLAVVESHRRRGVATGLIGELRKIASGRNAYVIFVQANTEDGPAIALYESLGTKEPAYHFDIEVPTHPIATASRTQRDGEYNPEAAVPGPDADVRFGSGTDIVRTSKNVRLTPETVRLWRLKVGFVPISDACYVCLKFVEFDPRQTFPASSFVTSGYQRDRT